jgi:hypothetical protein
MQRGDECGHAIDRHSGSAEVRAAARDDIRSPGGTRSAVDQPIDELRDLLRVRHEPEHIGLWSHAGVEAQ